MTSYALVSVLEHESAPSVEREEDGDVAIRFGLRGSLYASFDEAAARALYAALGAVLGRTPSGGA